MTPVSQTATLTISLSQKEGDGYTVDLRFEQSDRPSRIAPARGSASFDFVGLRAASLDPRAYGHKLATALFADPRIRSYFDKAWVASQQDGGRLRLVLQIDPGVAELRELHGLRWETLCHPECGDFLFSDANLPFSRFLESPDWTKITLRPKGRLRALVAVANPVEFQGGKRLGVQVLAPVKVTDELYSPARG